MTVTDSPFRMATALLALLLGMGSAVPSATSACPSETMPSTCDHHHRTADCCPSASPATECLLADPDTEDAILPSFSDIRPSGIRDRPPESLRRLSPSSLPIVSSRRSVSRAARVQARLGVWIE